MQELIVPLGERSYPIYIGTGLLDKCGAWMRRITSSRVMLISNPTVYGIYGPVVQASLEKAGVESCVACLPDGEEYKNVDQALRILDQGLEAQLDRSSMVLALGGGVVGDLAGFVAAIYQRGIPFVQIPTTLLAQVDSSVGGKVGVNHARGKNLIGAFHQPRVVVADLDTLDTLQERDYISGLAEVVKYGVVCDAGLFSYLEEHAPQLLKRQKECLQHVVYACCNIKSEVVQRDERESGVRMVLNLGHTFGHSLEKLGHYRDYTHGEAVSMGTAAAAYLAVDLGLLKTGECRRIVRLLQRFGLPVQVPAYDPREVYAGMIGDKKASQDRLRFIVPKGIGGFCIAEDPGPEVVLKAIRTAQGEQA